MSCSMLQLVILLLALFYNGVSATTCEPAVDLAHILQNTAMLNITEEPIVVNPSQMVTLTCTTACGSIEWYYGNVTVITNSMYLCTNNGATCDHSVNSLGCANAADGKYVGNTLTFIPHETMQVQCRSRLTNIGVSGVFRIPSKAALIVVKDDPATPQPMATSTIVPSSTFSRSSSSSQAPTRPVATTSSSPQQPMSCSCSPSPVTPRPPAIDTMQVFQNATLCVSAQSFTFSAAGIGIVILIIALSGWITCCCCMKLRHNKSRKLVEPDNSSSRPSSTLDQQVDLTDSDWQNSSTAKIASMV